jgi:hypothetical protein
MDIPNGLFTPEQVDAMALEMQSALDAWNESKTAQPHAAWRAELQHFRQLYSRQETMDQQQMNDWKATHTLALASTLSTATAYDPDAEKNKKKTKPSSAQVPKKNATTKRSRPSTDLEQE